MFVALSCVLFFALLLLGSAQSFTISDAQGLIELSTNVSKKMSYDGLTVVLDADIDFTEAQSQQFEPIGKNRTYLFCGTFDGQGHTISNLKMNSSSQYAGLFGYSYGLTVKNLVIDGSCSITSTASSTSCTGSIIGYCTSRDEVCTIENVVNMESFFFTGNTTNNVLVGGIIGSLEADNNKNTLKNCVNYGSVTYSGTGRANWVELGGIVGLSSDQSTLYNSIRNCANYGAITQKGSSKNLAMGGIASISYYTTFENCVSSGMTVNQTDGYIGGIVGYIDIASEIEHKDTEITHCYWTYDTGINDICGYIRPTEGVTIKDNSLTTLNRTTLNTLSGYAGSNGWNKWVMLHLNGGRIGNASQGTIITPQKYIPGPVIDGNTFLFWCKDSGLTEEFDPETDDISTVTDLYVAWMVNTVTFDFGNGTSMGRDFSYNEAIDYPENPEKEGYSFKWVPEVTNMPAHNITTTAQWVINNYTLTFIFDNGTDPEVRVLDYNSLIDYPAISERVGYTSNGWDTSTTNMPAHNLTIKAQWTPNTYTVSFNTSSGNDLSLETKQVTFNSAYGTLPTPSRPAFTFAGWFTDGGVEVTNTTIVTIPSNHTLTARWEEVPTTQVEIVFGTKDMTKKDIEKAIKEYTGADFEIKEIVSDGGDTRVIVEFKSTEESEEFVRSVRGFNRVGGNKKLIKRIGFNTVNSDVSFSPMHHPFLLLGVFVV